MPETPTTRTARKPQRPRPRSRTTPLGAETAARLAPSATSLGSAYAEQILEGFRRELEGVDLKASKPAKRSGRRKS